MKFIFENCNTLEEIAKGYFIFKENFDILEKMEKGRTLQIRNGLDIFTLTKNNASVKVHRKSI
jgi:hypothetical protein